jgi:hypothetical protein
VPTLIGILGVSRPLLFVIAALIGLSTTLGRHGFDSLLQHRAPVALRGRAAARYETRFQLVWAFGALIATPISLPAEASMAVLTALYVPALIVYLRASNEAKVFEEVAALDLVGQAGTRLGTAIESMNRGAPRIAVLEAAAAVDLARVEDPTIGERSECIELARLRMVVLDPDETVADEDAQRAIALAETLISSLGAESAS